MERINLTKNQKYDGYYFFSPSADFFFITDFSKYKRKSPWIVKLIDECLKKNGCTWRGVFDSWDLKDALERGTIELKSNGLGDYYNIDLNGCHCGDYVWNRETIIYQL